VKPVRVIYDLGIPKHDKEGRTITSEFEKFYLITSYVPNSGMKLDRLDYRVTEWDKDFQQFIQDLEATGKPVVLCGDLNVAHGDIDVHNPKGLKKCAGFTNQERESFGKFLDLGYIDTFRHFYPTEQKFSFWSAKTKAREADKGWRLDYFVTSKSMIDSVKDSEIHSDFMGSDH
jgi:exodeoxyribonuclease III